MIDLHEVAPERRAGVALDGIAVDRRQWLRQNRRPAALTAREALAAVQFEAQIIWMGMASMRAGFRLTDDHWARVTLAMRNIDTIVDEVIA